MNENKNMIRTIVIVAVMCLLVIGYYAYLSDKTVKEKQNKQLTEKEELLLYDLDQDYPHSPRDVIKLYSRMMTCLYNERLEDDDLNAMVDQMRKLYAEELVSDEGNTKEQQISKLNDEIQEFEENDKITNYVLSEVSQTEYGMVDGNYSALVEATYTLRKGNQYPKILNSYVLIQEEDENWRILGWKEDALNTEAAQE